MCSCWLVAICLAIKPSAFQASSMLRENIRDLCGYLGGGEPERTTFCEFCLVVNVLNSLR